METDGKFYLGRLVDRATGERTADPLLYDPDDLTTHAVVVGMTGSGKTGLCIDLLEEAALNNLPALMIDPKGDITNALLHFPDLAPADFEPWINADAARRDGKSVAQAAADTAGLWRHGLAEWGIEPERLARLKAAVHCAVYTPGSDAGIPVSILASLAAPEIAWEGNREVLREKISGTVTAILGLVGLKDIDPVRSREHILLANIFEQAWSQGQDLTLPELILQTQNPPFDKLGVFDVNTFFPEKDRFRLAMDLNNILAAPAFQAWIEGEPLAVGNLLYHPDGRPRHSVFYIAHLSEAERMFFVTLLFSAVETWMRAQKGTTSLRALVYFDEIFGYLPPIGNPPSKEPMLRLLKQARAFGVGLVLATQNPVDVDYKALSNAGTWFVGKLGTEQDKQRLLDGLTSAMGGALDRSEYDNLISALGKRVFLLRNVHDKRPSLFQTRWAMNYLAGPMTRRQIPALNALAGATITALAPHGAHRPAAEQASPAAPPAAPARPPAQPVAPALPGSPTRATPPGRVAEYFLPPDQTVEEAAAAAHRAIPMNATPLGVLYRPTLLAQSDVRFTNRKYNLNTELVRAALVPEPDPRGAVRWEEYLVRPLGPRDLDTRPVAEAHFVQLEGPFADSKAFSSWQSDFADWVYRRVEVTVRANETLGIFAGPETSEAEFRRQATRATEEALKKELDAEEARWEVKLDRIEDRLKREERELREDEAELSARKREETSRHIETLFGFLSGRRSGVSSSLSKRRMTERAKQDVEESEETIEDLRQELEELARDREEALAAIRQHWADIGAQTAEIQVQPYKKDINVSLFGVAWLPYHVLAVDDRLMELPAYAVVPADD